MLIMITVEVATSTNPVCQTILPLIILVVVVVDVLTVVGIAVTIAVVMTVTVSIINFPDIITTLSSNIINYL